MKQDVPLRLYAAFQCPNLPAELHNKDIDAISAFFKQIASAVGLYLMESEGSSSFQQR